jgi:hypothetical protein
VFDLISDRLRPRSSKQEFERVKIFRRKLPGLNLKPIAPVSVSEPLQYVPTTGQEARFPLFHDVEILVHHQGRIIEEVVRASAQIDTSPPRRGKRFPVQMGKKRVLDHLDTRNVIPEEVCKGASRGLWQRCPPSHMANRSTH